MNIKNIFKSKTEASDKKRFNKTLFRHGGYSIGIIAIALACLILVNVLFSALGNRISLKLDLSFSGENSISEENAEFIKSIEKPVTLTVCATEADYAGGYMDMYAQQYHGVYDEGGYYAQTIRLINLYKELNKNITVEYLDLSSTAGSAIVSEFPSIFYGDIIVRHTDNEGNATSKLVTFEDIYAYEDSSGYGYYYSVTANRLESALSSAINSCLSGEVKSAALIATYSDADIFDALFGSQLKLNGFEITKISDNIITKIPENTEQLYIIAPTKDMLPDELTVINNWLYNGGNRGRSLIFIPSTSVTNLPNLVEFLKEWGVSYSDGILYETNSSNHYSGSPTTLVAFNNETELKIANESKSYILGHNLPMKAEYETYSTKKTDVIVSTADSVVAAPLGIDSDWAPSADLTRQNFPNLIVTTDSDVVGEDLKKSYVAAFSSFDFIYSQWAQYSQLGNMEAALNTAIVTAGFDTDSQLLFLDKTVTVESFADKVSEFGAITIRIIFMILIPILLIAAGVIIWLRRRNR